MELELNSPVIQTIYQPEEAIVDQGPITFDQPPQSQYEQLGFANPETMDTEPARALNNWLSVVHGGCNSEQLTGNVVSVEFQNFMIGVLQSSTIEAESIELLAQHIITLRKADLAIVQSELHNDPTQHIILNMPDIILDILLLAIGEDPETMTQVSTKIHELLQSK